MIFKDAGRKIKKGIAIAEIMGATIILTYVAYKLCQ